MYGITLEIFFTVTDDLSARSMAKALVTTLNNRGMVSLAGDEKAVLIKIQHCKFDILTGTFTDSRELDMNAVDDSDRGLV